MVDLDPDNCKKSFRIDDSQDSTHPENVVISAGQSVNRSMFPSESRGWQAAEMKTHGTSLSEDGINILIKLRHEFERAFLNHGHISRTVTVLWEDISRRLFEKGFKISAKQCATTWGALSSEYLEIVRSNDEKKCSGYKHFSVFENLYKLRSRFPGSGILIDIGEDSSSGYNCPSTSNEIVSLSNDREKGGHIDEAIQARLPKEGLGGEDFSTLRNKGDNQIPIKVISVTPEILEDNSMNSDGRPIEGITEKTEASAAGEEISLFVEEKKNPSKTETLTRSPEIEIEDQSLGCSIFMPSKNGFSWDSDSLQCFLDLRLYAETNGKIRQSILRRYRSELSFVRRKMLQNGFKISIIDCKEKWTLLMKSYNSVVRCMTARVRNQDPLQKVKTYFWQMEKILRQYEPIMGRRMSHGYIWDEGSIKRLISIRLPMDNAFLTFKRYVILWQYVASEMQKYKYSPTYNDCSVKWIEICETHRIHLDSVRSGEATYVDWKFDEDMRRGFDAHAKNINAAVNYNYDVDTEYQVSITTEYREKTVEGSAYCAFFGSSEAPVKIKLDAPRRKEHVNATNNSLGEPESNPHEIDTDMEITTLGDLNVQPGDQESIHIQWLQTELSKCEEFEQSLGDYEGIASKVKRVEATESGEEAVIERSTNTASATPSIRPKKHMKKHGKSKWWTKDATKTLIRLKSCDKVRRVKEYSELLMKKMRAIGYSQVTAGQIYTKWSHLCVMYNQCVIRKITGPPVGWPYFKLMDEYMKNESRKRISKIKMNSHQFSWTPKSIHKLINSRVMFKDRYRGSKQEDLKDLWMKISNVMTEAGFKVTYRECVAQWKLLIESYRKTRLELAMGTRVVIGRYFTAMNKATTKLIDNEGNVEEGIDVNIGKNEAKHGDNCEKSTADSKKSFSNTNFEGNTSFKENTSSTSNQIVFGDKEQNNIEKNAFSLITKRAVPRLNCISINRLNEATEKTSKYKFDASSNNDSSDSGRLWYTMPKKRSHNRVEDRL